MTPIEIAGFILIKNNKVLVEKRKLNKKIFPGKITIPAGHIEKGETQEEAVTREVQEEFDITTNNQTHICSLINNKYVQPIQTHYYLITSWNGTIKNNEAAAIEWISLNNLSKLYLETDKKAIQKYLSQQHNKTNNNKTHK